ncbi:MAG: bifunctional folylpolyglutamate synthase/dihydrofolate synthase [Clostridia bacterium]|nr:bifunctional folylpolyglutamate synthase/dihydrofolate synthase [Clostridia bacterium]
MNFKESVQYVESANRKSRDKADLSVIRELLTRLGNPQNNFKSIHIAGTNGKGSVCAFVESALRVQGYKTGLFTSPYITVFNERIRVCGKNIENEEFALLASKIRNIAEGMEVDGYPLASFFEMLTAISFKYFSDLGVEVAVIETGIGGTYDSTNVINPILSIITSIGYDHMNILGNTIEEIAENKAGIIKLNCPVVISHQAYDEAYAVFLNKAMQLNAPLFALEKSQILIDFVGLDGAQFNFTYDGLKADIKTTLIGIHQVYNASCAFLSLCVLSQYSDIKMSPKSILKGIEEAQWPGRMEILRNSPLVIVDGAHNEQAAGYLVNSIKNFIPSGKINVIFGTMKRKNYLAMAKKLKEIAECIYTVSINDDNSMDGKELLEELKELNLNAESLGSFVETYEFLVEKGEKPILICGSLYLAGEARRHILLK